MSLLLTHTYYGVLETLRLPVASVPTLVFPAMFFLFFAVPAVQDNPFAAIGATSGILVFSTLLTVLFQFGVGIAEDRRHPWGYYARTLPVRPWQRFGGLVGTALVFAAAGAVILVAVSAATTALSVPLERWPLAALVLLAGAVPLSLLGIGIGYGVAPKAAVPVANLVMFPLAFGGGLFIPPDQLPSILRTISLYLPTRNWLEVMYAAMFGAEIPWEHVAALLGWTALFATLTLVLYRRDEGQRFS